jgi:hypothetical protein
VDTGVTSSNEAGNDAGTDAFDAGPCPGQTVCPSGCADLQTSAANCGTCGHNCGADDTCEGGVCQVVTVAAADPGAPFTSFLAVSAADPTVFWMSRQNSTITIYECGTVGCTTPVNVNSAGDLTITSTSLPFESPIFLAADQKLQWISYSSTEMAPMIFSCPQVGCNHITRTEADNPDAVTQIALSPADGGTLFYGNNTGFIYKCPFGSCSSANQTRVTAPADQINIVIAADATQFYYASDDSQSNWLVYACPITGCPGNNNALFGAAPTLLTVNSTTLFAVAGGTTALANCPAANCILSCATTGCSGNPTTLASNLPNVTAVVADDKAVYYALGGTAGHTDGQVVACTLPSTPGAPCVPHVIASGLASPNSLSLSNGVLYWSNGGIASGAPDSGVPDGGVPGSIQKYPL